MFLSRPGAIYTPIQVSSRDPSQMECWGKNSGLQRPGEPSEVATSFVFLASADASLYCKYSLSTLRAFQPFLSRICRVNP